MNDKSTDFSQRLTDLIAESPKNKQQIADEIGISPAALSKYSNGKAEPGIFALKKIASYFQVSADYLIGETKSRSCNASRKALGKTLRLSDDAIDNLTFREERDYLDFCNTPEQSGEFAPELIREQIKKYYEIQNAMLASAMYIQLLKAIQRCIDAKVKLDVYRSQCDLVKKSFYKKKEGVEESSYILPNYIDYKRTVAKYTDQLAMENYKLSTTTSKLVNNIYLQLKKENGFFDNETVLNDILEDTESTPYDF